ncbi:Receptor ligand binding region [Trinorchestia longiramus]|nr:Receptor ligand binding region [Trinorchestia longiramus]
MLSPLLMHSPMLSPLLMHSPMLPPQAEPALVYDSVNVFAKGLHALERSATLALANLSCDSETPWDDGSSLFNYINTVEYDGVTGPIKFLEGKRSNFKLDVLKLRCEEIHKVSCDHEEIHKVSCDHEEIHKVSFDHEEIHKVGQWTPEMGINITDHQAFFEGGKPNITLKVITVERRHCPKNGSCSFWKWSELEFRKDRMQNYVLNSLGGILLADSTQY